MSIAPDRAEAHARDLERFQAIAMHAAEKAHAAIEAAEAPADLCALIDALAKAGRILRMSIALETKLARDAAREARDGQARDEAAAARTVATRKARVAAEVDRMIWTELDVDDAQVATGELSERLETESLEDGFAEEPVEAQVERLAGLLGLTGAPVERYIPASMRHQAHRLRARWDAEDAEDDGPPPEPDPATVAEAREVCLRATAHYTAARDALIAARNPDPFNGRLAPPIEPPSWECDDDTS